jgi:small conductance mechanosensitive channel
VPDIPLVSLFGLLIFGFVSLFISWIIIKKITAFVKRSQLSTTKIKNVTRGILIIWGSVTIVWVLQILGLTSFLSSLTFSSIVGIGITLALQSTLSNILSGVLLLQENVLRLGDVIQFSGVKGEVIKLGFRSTWLRTSEGEIVIVSNKSLSDGPFINYTATERLSKNLTQRIQQKLKPKA